MLKKAQHQCLCFCVFYQADIYEHNRELLERCNTLREYAIFVGKVKEYAKTIELLPAINLAVDECIFDFPFRTKSGILKKSFETSGSRIREENITWIIMNKHINAG